ncbi:hypothetical protein GIB67_034964 [Kingdonia uniflora]|uniref:Kinesin motor domain-containing protein n=1 Tax=Kingdonia uniflora TaxID=39325 RepID=A0A7J7NH70_9MAGN|nr:hypothetical protein GIB67_034964 [Kingdonia uniflora]
MKRGAILRENFTSETLNPSSLNPNFFPKPKSSPISSSRKQKSSKENTDPNGLPEVKSSPAMAKIKSNLPPRPPSSNLNPLKRKLVMESVPEHSVPGFSSDSGVKVIVRVRPLNKAEEEGETIIQNVSGDSLSVLGHDFNFDSVANTESTQEDIFRLVGVPLVENCLAGFNSSIFAYGQTGSGKTYTMSGPANALLEGNLPSNEEGLTPRVFERLFSRISEEQVKHADKQLKYQCRCSFLEIYNEQITDLLDPKPKNLQIREDVKSGVYVEDLSEEYVSTTNDVTQLLIKGLSNRRTGSTSVNAESSRSHSVFTCVVESECKSMADGVSNFKVSRINLVDLAGSERQKATGAAGERLKEAGNINRSLSQLGNLINILAEVSQSGKQRHIPYRDSRLTFLLQESLGGNAKLAMICAISPAQSCKSETFSTLRFAQRAKAIKNKAVINEVMKDDVNVLREVIRQLKDELLRMKENKSPTGTNGGYSTSWNARKSLNLLKMSLSRPMTLPHIEDDSDEEMEIDEEAVERLVTQVDDEINLRVGSVCGSDQYLVDFKMEECQVEEDCKDGFIIDDRQEPGSNSLNEYANEKLPEPDVKKSVSDVSVAYFPCNSPTRPHSSVLPSDLSIVPSETSPVLCSPSLSVSPRVNDHSRKSLKTSSMLSASQKDEKSPTTPTEYLAASLNRGLQILDNHRQSLAMRRSSYRCSYKPVDLKPSLPFAKVDVGVQTLFQDIKEPLEEDTSVVLCSNCKNRADIEFNEVDENLNLQLVSIDELQSADKQLVPVAGPQSADKSKNQVPKAVEKVLAGAIRREMALEEFCSKQTAEIMQLNRLVQQYKHERECTTIIEQTREDKIIRLESLMDGVLPTEEFMSEELLSLTDEHKILKDKYDNNPEVLRTKIELKRVQDELDNYRNFFDMGERDVLMEEIQHLRSQLQYYIDVSSPISARKRSPILRITSAPESCSTPLCTILESNEKEESVEENFEQERQRWTEAESNWISLSEDLRTELDKYRSISEKQKQELDSEKKCSEELKEAIQRQMQGHTRLLEQYADLEEKHMCLLARHRKIRDGTEDVKKAATKAGVKGIESKFINSIANQISALRVEKEKERRRLMDENKGLHAQLRDTAEAVQAAGELLVRLKESEEATTMAQKRALDAEEEAHRLKKKHEKEISTMNQFLAGSRLPKEALRPPVDDRHIPKYDVGDGVNATDEHWRDEFEPCYRREDDDEFSEPASWFSGYDRCNI